MPFSAQQDGDRAGRRRRTGASSTRRPKLDDYKGKDVKGKIVLVHRFAPADDKLDATATARLGDLRYKAFTASGKGAVGMIVVDDGDPKQDEAALPSLVPAAWARSTVRRRCRHPDRRRQAHGRRGAREGHAQGVKLAVALEPVRTPTDERRRRDPRGRGDEAARRRRDRRAPRSPRHGRRLERARSEGPRGPQRRRRQRVGRRRAARGRALLAAKKAELQRDVVRRRVLRRGDGRPRLGTYVQAHASDAKDRRRDDQHGHGRPDARRTTSASTAASRRRSGRSSSSRRARRRASSARSAARATARPITCRSTSRACRCCSSSPATTSTITPRPTTPTRSTRPAARASR